MAYTPLPCYQTVIWMQIYTDSADRTPVTTLRNYHPLIATFQTIDGPFHLHSADVLLTEVAELYFLIQGHKRMT